MKKLIFTYSLLLGLLIWINVYIWKLSFTFFFLAITLILPLIISFFVNWINNKLNIGKTLFTLNLLISFALSGCIGWYFYNQPDMQEWILEKNWNEEEKKIIHIALTHIKSEIKNPKSYTAGSLYMDRSKDSYGNVINYKIDNDFFCEDANGDLIKYHAIIVIDTNNKIIESKIKTTDNKM